jgi:menaquinone-specific isochorismate synthase
VTVGSPTGAAVARDRTGPDTLSAVRVVLPAGAPLDPYALAGDSGILVVDGGRVLVGLGAAATFELPDGVADPDAVDAVVDALAAVPCDDRVGAGSTGPGHPVVAFGALPFDRHAPGALVVPELLYCRERDGTEWVTLVVADGDTGPGPADPAAALRDRLAERAAAPEGGAAGPVGLRIEPRTSDDHFLRSVATAVDAISHHDLVKVVLARSVDVHLDHEVDLVALLRRWAAIEPSCVVFSVPTPDGQFVGASPELLVERHGTRFRSRPLAGTTDRVHGTGSGLPPELLDSAKDGEEHRLVVDAIREVLAPISADLDVPDRPELVHLHSITHLGTTVDGTLRPSSDGRVPSALHLVALLHPTPAVAGVPRRTATELIEELEPTPRGTYAGPVGYVDGAGDGRWMVGIRAMTVAGRSVRMTAGVGIVAGSRPETELVETRLKFRAVFDALAPGVPFDTGDGPDRG